MTLQRLVECSGCNGEKGHAVAYGVNPRNGEWLEYWVPCEWCGGKGEEWIDAELISEDDVYEMGEPA